MKAPRKFRVFDGGRDKPANARARGEGAREVDELLRLAVQVGNIGIFQTDFERDRTRFSPELCNILGLPAGTEMTFAQASQLFDESDRTLLARSAGLGLDVQSHYAAGRLTLRQIDPGELSPGEFVHMVRREADESEVRSLSGHVGIPSQKNSPVGNRHRADVC